MTSNGKQFTVTREMLTAVARISACYSKFTFVLFCYITNHLMTGPLGNSEFCFPRISMFPSTSSRETLRFSGNKIHCSPRDQSLSVNCYTCPPHLGNYYIQHITEDRQSLSKNASKWAALYEKTFNKKYRSRRARFHLSRDPVHGFVKPEFPNHLCMLQSLGRPGLWQI